MFDTIPVTVEAGPSDRPELILRAQGGDREAFCELCRVHGNRLLRQATLLCGDATLAEDLAQDTFLAAWKGLHRYQGRCQFFTWLCAILRNRHRNARRQNLPPVFSALGSHEKENLVNIQKNLIDDSSRPDQAAALAERAAFLWRCIEQLPAKQRDVVYLRFYVDHSLEAIAAALDCPLGTVKSRLFHAIDRLRAMSGMDGGGEGT